MEHGSCHFRFYFFSPSFHFISNMCDVCDVRVRRLEDLTEIELGFGAPAGLTELLDVFQYSCDGGCFLFHLHLKMHTRILVPLQ